MKMSEVSKTGAVRRSQYQIFPSLLADRHEALERSIVAHGVETATTWDDEGNLLDGWERERICEVHRLRCPREVRHFESEAEKFRFVLAVNAHRRPSLSQKQKREVIGSYLKGDAEIADNTLAQTLGVSKNTVLTVRHRLEATRQIAKVTKSRGKDGKLRPVQYTKRIITNTPKEFEKAKEIVKDLPNNCAGKTIDVTTASRRAKRNKTKEKRESRIIQPLPGEAIQIHHCRFQELEQRADIVPGTVKLISTDIPYGADFLSQLDDLGAFAQRVLTDGGLFVCLCGGYYLNQYIRVFDNYLSYRWLLSSQWDGDANLIHPLQVTSQQKPILLYSKGDWIKRPMWPDLIRVNCKEKEWDDWQQPVEESERLIKYFSDPGNLVVDPCGGGFTTAEACLRLSRRCVSCDVSSQCVSNGLDRLEVCRKRMTVGA
jgi:site-specific DNA-methyltransferase (adenine-specific)